MRRSIGVVVLFVSKHLRKSTADACTGTRCVGIQTRQVSACSLRSGTTVVLAHHQFSSSMHDPTLLDLCVETARIEIKVTFGIKSEPHRRVVGAASEDEEERDVRSCGGLRQRVQTEPVRRR